MLTNNNIIPHVPVCVVLWQIDLYHHLHAWQILNYMQPVSKSFILIFYKKNSKNNLWS